MTDRAAVDQYLNDRRPQRTGSAGYDNVAVCEINVEHVAISFSFPKYARTETKSKPLQLLLIIRMFTNMAEELSPLTLYSTRRWIEHFELNRRRQPAQPWERGAKLTHAERFIVIDSIRQFQLGESGEGRHIKKCAAVHARRIDDLDYPDAMHLFIAEEQRHSAMLGQYLDLAHERRLTKSKVDGIFRWLRHLMGLELSLIVLSTAEVVASVYYRALRDATECDLLQSICRRILRDEAAHLAFHRDRFLILRWNRSLVTRSILRLMHHCLLMVTLLPVWWCHARVFRAGGISFFKLTHDTHCRLHQDLRRVGLRVRLRKMISQVIPPPLPPRSIADTDRD